MFTTRNQAGKLLAEKIKQEPKPGPALVLSLPRGGVVIGAAIAALLDLPHRVVVAKKIPAPNNPELALGAVSQNKESLFLNRDLIKGLKVSSDQIETLTKQTIKKVKKVKNYLLKNGKINLNQKTIIIADDGAATGATMIAAIRETRAKKPKKIIVALPVAPPETVKNLEEEADQIIVLEQPELFFSVSQFYQDFPQISLDQAKKILSLQP